MFEIMLSFESLRMEMEYQYARAIQTIFYSKVYLVYLKEEASKNHGAELFRTVK